MITVRRYLPVIAATLALSACQSTPPGLDRLPPQAAELVASAAKGNAEAMEGVGEVFHYGGPGIERDLATALLWYQAAADRGLASAQDYVGMFHAGGLGGVKESCEAAIHWFLRAADGGHVESKNNAAWMLATCPDARFRDGKKAVMLATATIAALGRKAGYVGTLAAAHAELGDFPRAVALQEESLQLMAYENASSQQTQEAIARLKTFRDGKPWRGASYVDPDAYKPQSL